MATASRNFPIVGVGASAGGIPAMEGFFKGLPDNCGMAFAVVTHLSPERESLLHEVIGRYTDMDVKVVEDDMPVEQGPVYVMPQNAILTIDDARLRIHRPDAKNRERKPIDIFFSTLAKDQGERSVGIVLSGGDSDGTLGLKAIKENGGLTMAQLPNGSGPRNPDMPQSAIASGVVDIAIPAEEMGQKLIDLARGFDLSGDPGESAWKAEEKKLDGARDAIYAVLRGQSGHDFSGYKTKTFFRRVRRRMQLAQITSAETYIGRLRTDPGEAQSLFRDLLINVTAFFRDADAFKALGEIVIPRLFEGRTTSDTVRVWVPGCATGEEVYSIGILLREYMDTLTEIPRVHIFATDIDEPAIAVARAGRYPEALLEGVSAERRRRFFDIDGASYVLSKEVRKLCIFSPHSVIRDPPFSRMDLVSCRNLLIYFGRDVQERVIPAFHYALKPGGYLFLGSSESISQHGSLFATVDKKHRLFQAREHAANAPRLPPMLASSLSTGGNARSGERSPAARFPLRQTVEAHVLERYSPAHVVVNAEGDVVYYSAKTGKYLEAAQGAPTRQLVTLARRGLRLDLRSGLREAIETRATIVRDNIAIDEDGDRVQFVTLTIEPLADRDHGEALFLVLFEPVGAARNRTELEREEQSACSTAELEREVRDTRERLQSTIEEYETALEELKSSNEELVSVNEESQSTNEELEASREEMQSLNEELNTINAELSGKLEELDRANSDLKNLFEATQIATVFLDRNLVIRNFTPAASTFFNLRPADVGRPLTDLATQLDYPGLRMDIAEVFGTGNTIEHRLPRDIEGAHYLVRLIPYRDGDSRIEGVVATFIDITRLGESEERQRLLISELNHRVKNMLSVVISIANHTLKNASSPEAFSEALVGRLHSMARAHGLLSRENWAEAAVDELIRQEIEPYGLGRFEIAGPALRLKPQQGLSLGMVIHELATNAAKYGALSVPEGRVALEWTSNGTTMALKWRERNGPQIDEPERTGFGFALLKGEIGYRLGGTVGTFFNAEGLEVQFSFPLQ
ncbi:PAS domain-containing protein [Pararhizobium sp. LjRoot235]|uniref:CheR family methyltransferase n=1 Tax=Pararhizobium sp. LjRoot235 TaxID=3342291 RepID=UPI003ECEBD63